MNQIRAIQALNKREIENGIPPEASWHVDYRDTAYVYFGGLPYELSEGDIITIFSQFGEPVFLKLVRDKESGKSKGFGWLKYEDQRSTDLAVDNLGGAEIGGRLIRVDHARYKVRDDEDTEEGKIGWQDLMREEKAQKGEVGSRGASSGEENEEGEEERHMPMLKEERELQLLIQEHDDDDPMKPFLVDEKKKEVEEALRREKKRAERHAGRHKERHHHPHRSRRDGSADDSKNTNNRGDLERTYKIREEHRLVEGSGRRDNGRRDGDARARSRESRDKDGRRDRSRYRYRDRDRDRDRDEYERDEKDRDRKRIKHDREALSDRQAQERIRSESRSPRRR